MILGDSGVGKSSLVHMLCHNEPLRNQMPTVGCNVDVRLHTSTIPSAAAYSSSSAAASISRSVSGIPSLLSRADPAATGSGASGSGEPTFIEFYDVSGTPGVRHQKTRNMIYSGIAYHGLVLVHDLCIRRSYDNLWKWIGDYMEASSQLASTSAANNGAAGGGYHFGGQYDQPLSIPLLVVGTKMDMASAASSSSFTSAGAGTAGSTGGGIFSSRATDLDLATKYGGEAISVCAISPADFMPNSSTCIAFNMFLGRVMNPSSAGLSIPRTPSNQSGIYTTSAGSVSESRAESPGFPRPSPTPTPGHHQQHHDQHQQEWERPQYQDRTYSDDTKSGPLSIPIMDFATFTGGASTRASSAMTMGSSDVPPPRVGSPVSRPITPTGMSSGTALSTKSALRAQYERNRSVLSQYSNMGVPVYTSNNTSGSTGGGR
ncbi:Rab-like protein 3 [Dissophora globulifera]|uniref:Rab-like protein 3 n=1 Tax=Dissophora globulifera TaxID=979702 RepID=A0A9P6UXU6_9FUNG|nr:Rab-like protein 3 [Dissophora globulifera]